MDLAVEEGKRIAEALLDWIRMETCEEIVTGIRFDFFVNYKPFAKGENWVSKCRDSDWASNKGAESIRKEEFIANPEKGGFMCGDKGIIKVTTLEICELGFSCLENEELRRACMPAIVRSCLR